LAIDY